MDVSFERKRLARLPLSGHPDSVLFAPDGRTVAFSVGEHDFIHQGGPMHVVDGGKEHPAYSEVSYLRLGFDGRSLAYFARRDQKWCAVVDGKPGPAFDYVSDLTFHHEAAYVASIGGKWVSTYGRNQLSGYVTGVLSEYSGGEWYVVAGGRPGPKFEEVEGPVFSPDGKRLAYKAKTGSRAFMIVDGLPGEQYDDVLVPAYLHPVFSPDSKILAYVAVKGNRQHVVLGATEGPGYYRVGQLQFTPGGEVAYVGQREGRVNAIIGSRESESYDQVRDLVFSADGKRDAFVACRVPQGAISQGVLKSFAVVNGIPGEEFDDIDLYSLRFALNGSGVVFVAKVQSRSVVVSPTGRSEPFDTILFPVSDGSKTAFAARQDERWYVVAGAAKSGPFEGVHTALTFSPDGRKVAFGCQRGAELWWEVVDVP